MRTLAFRHVVYPAALAVTGQGATHRYLRRLRGAEHDPPERVRERQRRRLLRLVARSRSGSEYYRDVLPALESDTSLTEALSRIPVLERRTLQDSGERLCVPSFKGRVATKTTGGSTGAPVRVVKNADAVARERAASWLGYGWFGIRPGDRSVRFWGGATTASRRLSAIAADGAMNRTTFAAFAFDESDLARYWERCLSIRPRWIYGYVSMIEEFARFVASRGYDGSGLGLDVVVTTAEALTEVQRDLISDVFGAPVQDEYGCGEVGPIAYECPQGSLHLMAENLLVEVVDDAGERMGTGGSGEILVTDLGNVAMPLIRYRIGDFGTVGTPCRCGRTLPVLQRVWGRAYDFVTDAKGRRYHGEFFMYLFEDLRRDGLAVDQFQVTQTPEGSIRIDVTGVESGRPESALEAIRGAAAARLPDVPIAARFVDEIQREASGKLRVIVNETAGRRAAPVA
jgi:phenylacetate-CoA ligase